MKTTFFGFWPHKDKRVRDVIQRYRQTFGASQDAKDTLAHFLITSCGLLQKVETEEARVRHNMGVELLMNLGAVQGWSYELLIDDILRRAMDTEAIENQKAQS